jgi:hypothetical protein
MGFSDVLATTALVVSIVSAWLSYKAHRESTQITEREARREFSRERAEFLIRIERSTKLFERVEARIRTLLAGIESGSVAGQSPTGEMAQQLKADLSYLQGCLRQSRSLWDENYEMSHDGLAHHKPRHLALLEDDENFAHQAMDRAAKAEESLNMSAFLSNPVVG